MNGSQMESIPRQLSSLKNLQFIYMYENDVNFTIPNGSIFIKEEIGEHIYLFRSRLVYVEPGAFQGLIYWET